MWDLLCFVYIVKSCSNLLSCIKLSLCCYYVGLIISVYVMPLLFGILLPWKSLCIDLPISHIRTMAVKYAAKMVFFFPFHLLHLFLTLATMSCQYLYRLVINFCLMVYPFIGCCFLFISVYVQPHYFLLLFQVKRTLGQFTPAKWDKDEWHPLLGPWRFIQVLSLCIVFLTVELNTFFLKFCLWIPPRNPVIVYRLVLWWLIALPTIREYNSYLQDRYSLSLSLSLWGCQKDVDRKRYNGRYHMTLDSVE